MGSPSSTGLVIDEVHCLWPQCTHTCCWEAEQRICDGRGRVVKAQTLSMASETVFDEEIFPALTVADVSEWPDAGAPYRLFSLDSEEDFSKAATSPQALPRAAGGQENVQMPSTSSAWQTHLDSPRENKTVKLKTITLSPVSGHTSVVQPSKPTVTRVYSAGFVPNRDSQHSAKSARMAVKEVSFLPSTEINKSAENEKRLKKETLRQRALLKRITLKTKPKQKEGKGSVKWRPDPDLLDPGLSWQGSGSERQKVSSSVALPQLQCLLPGGQTLAAAPELGDEQQQQPPRSGQTPHHQLLVCGPVR